MSEHAGVTATMPMPEYLRLKALSGVLNDLTAVTKVAPALHSGGDFARGYGIKYTNFDSLEEVCNAVRVALGELEIR